MKEIIEKEPKYESIICGYKEVKYFISEDGIKHDTKERALNRDRYLKETKQLSQIKHFCSDILDQGVWYYPKNKKELEFLLIYFSKASRDVCSLGHEPLHAKVWTAFKVEEAGDYGRDKLFITSLNIIEKEIYKMKNNIK